MKKIIMLLVVSLIAFGCATAKTDVTKSNPAENVNPPAAPANPEPSGNVTPSAAPASPQPPATPTTGSDTNKMHMDVTDMSTASNNTLSEKEDPNAVKYPGVSIPNVAKKERLNTIFIKSGKGEVDTNPYSDAGVKPESQSKYTNTKKGFGIDNPAQKETNNKIMLKTDAITNPKDENISSGYQVSSENNKTEESNIVSDYKSVVGIKNVVIKEVSDKIAVKTGRSFYQENPTGSSSGKSVSTSSKLNGVSIPNPVQKSTNSFINTKTKGVGLWE